MDKLESAWIIYQQNGNCCRPKRVLCADCFTDILNCGRNRYQCVNLAQMYISKHEQEVKPPQRISNPDTRHNIINTAAWLQHNGHKDLAEQLVSILEGK